MGSKYFTFLADEHLDFSGDDRTALIKWMVVAFICHHRQTIDPPATDKLTHLIVNDPPVKSINSVPPIDFQIAL
jgi:hypothetical protein